MHTSDILTEIHLLKENIETGVITRGYTKELYLSGVLAKDAYELLKEAIFSQINQAEEQLKEYEEYLQKTLADNAIITDAPDRDVSDLGLHK